MGLEIQQSTSLTVTTIVLYVQPFIEIPVIGPINILRDFQIVLILFC